MEKTWELPASSSPPRFSGRWAIPIRASQKSQAALVLAQELMHAHTLAEALYFAARFHYLRREASVTQELAERGVALCAEQGLSYWLATSTIWRGWALAVQGQSQEGTQQIEDRAGSMCERQETRLALEEASGSAGRSLCERWPH